jgi:acetoacetyl-[acyl-carrier protein] synthase
MVIDSLPDAKRDATYLSLAQMMGLDPGSSHEESQRTYMRDHTLVRRIELFDPNKVYWQSNAHLKSTDSQAISFVLAKRQLPTEIPTSWDVKTLNEKEVLITSTEPVNALLPDYRASKVTSAGQLPTGFDPAALYQSRNHPRGLQMTVFAASDALRSTGFSISELKSLCRPDQIAVYSGSAMGQLDAESYGGLLQNSMIGKRPSSKHVALGLPEMPGDFVNAYVLGSVGETAGIIGACATFLYNVKRGLDEIRSGSKRIVVVGNSEAPVVPAVIEGYRTMGALAEDDALMALDGSTSVDNRRACRPFSSNAGFTVAESSVWIVLMDDELAMESGARVLGAVADVAVNADGYKKSIPGPGIGNYVTVAKTMATARAILGEEGLRNSTYMQAHGTGTPQNRVTESQILNKLATNFGIDNWLVGAIKCYVGHSMAPAGGDQLSAILGAWEDGIVPGISTIDHIADDVEQSNLHLPMEDVERSPEAMRGAFINSKGFGGNNATGLFLSPNQTRSMLEQRWGKKAYTAFCAKQEHAETAAQDYSNVADSGNIAPIYKFGEDVLSGTDLTISPHEIHVPGFGKPVSLDADNPFEDMV